MFATVAASFPCAVLDNTPHNSSLSFCRLGFPRFTLGIFIFLSAIANFAGVKAQSTEWASSALHRVSSFLFVGGKPGASWGLRCTFRAGGSRPSCKNEAANEKVRKQEIERKELNNKEVCGFIFTCVKLLFCLRKIFLFCGGSFRAVCYTLLKPRKEVKKVRKTSVERFLCCVTRILDWSAIDAGTKDVLRHLMIEVSKLIRDDSE